MHSLSTIKGVLMNYKKMVLRRKKTFWVEIIISLSFLLLTLAIAFNIDSLVEKHPDKPAPKKGEVSYV